MSAMPLAGTDLEIPSMEKNMVITALSADVEIVAIGAPLKNGIGSDSGHVRVFGIDV